MLRTTDERLVPVEVFRRPLRTGLRGNEVYSFRDLTERHRNEARIAHMAHHDALTDLPNRTLMRERLERALQSQRADDQVAVLCLDLDHFKAVNDTLGHPIGDALLRKVARRLLECVRESDTVARIGGDEFVVLQRTSDPTSQSAWLADRIIETLSAPYVVKGHEVNIGTSVGISVPMTPDISADTLIAQADMALYSAKGSGRGTYAFFEQEMNTRAHARRELERDLRSAVTNNELLLGYQPIIDLQTSEVSGVEALLRWQHPKRGVISPESFISIAEETGAIVEIGEWVLREACSEAASWPEHVSIAINLSPIQFKSPRLIVAVAEAIAAAGIAAQRVELEITESVLLQSSDKTLLILRGLRDLGVRISLDDFGTGYSSLSYLQNFVFDKIKIDRCFITDADGIGGGLAVIRAICGLGRSLGISVLVEGVETAAQVEIARREGCAEVQGYYFSPPVGSNEIGRMLLEPAQKPSSTSLVASGGNRAA